MTARYPTLRELHRILRELENTYGSQKAAAEHIGISAPTFSRLLSGDRKPGIKTLKALGILKP